MSESLVESVVVWTYTDVFELRCRLSPASATLVNSTAEDSNMTALAYTGTWNNNSDALFSGGGTTYTNEENATVTLKFYGMS